MRSITRLFLFIGALALATLACNAPTAKPSNQSNDQNTNNSQSQNNAVPSATPTPQPATVTVSVATNCRTGPSPDYPLVILFNPGATAPIIGKYSTSSVNYWIISLPNNSATCWLWGAYATTQGDTSNLPVMTPPPPTVVQQSSSSNQSDNNNSGNNAVSAPSAPGNVKASTTCAGGRKDLITWNLVDNVDGYIVYKEGSKIAKLAKDDLGSSGSYQSLPGNIQPPITYGVAAYNSGGKSDMVTAKALGCP